MSKSITKVSAVMLAIMTLLSSIFVVQVDAATGDKVTIAFYYCLAFLLFRQTPQRATR